MRKIGKRYIVMSMLFCQYFAKIYCIFILQNFVLKLDQMVTSVFRSLCLFTHPLNLHICIINKLFIFTLDMQIRWKGKLAITSVDTVSSEEHSK